MDDEGSKEILAESVKEYAEKLAISKTGPVSLVDCSKLTVYGIVKALSYRVFRAVLGCLRKMRGDVLA